MAKTVLVTGATGTQGGATARLLLSRGHNVKALTRSADSASAARLRQLGVETVEGDLEDGASLGEAMAGCDAVFGMSTPFEAGTEAEVRQGCNLADAAHATGTFLIFSSVAWAYGNTGIPHFDSKWKVEQHIAGLDVPHTVLGPAYFMQNILSPWTVPALREGTLGMPVSSGLRQPMIAVENIAEMAALAVEHPERLQNRRIDMASDTLTGPEAAAILTDVAGRPFRYQELPKNFLPSEDLRTMFEWFENNKPAVDMDALRRTYPEVGWMSFREWAAKQNWQALLSNAG